MHMTRAECSGMYGNCTTGPIQ